MKLTALLALMAACASPCDSPTIRHEGASDTGIYYLDGEPRLSVAGEDVGSWSCTGIGEVCALRMAAAMNELSGVKAKACICRPYPANYDPCECDRLVRLLVILGGE